MPKFSDIKSGRQALDDKELAQATRALARWFTSQRLPPAEAIPVMVMGIVVALASIAEDDKDLVTGTNIVSKMLIETVEAGSA